MITSLPAILGYNIENIKQKIDDLKSLGFADPTKMITSLPAILGLNIENIKQKIDDLKSLGFADPTKMITSLPAILGLNIENIKRKIFTLGNLFELYDIDVDVKKFIEDNLSLLGTKIDKIWIIARALKTLGVNPKNITTTFLSRLLFSNITNVVTATFLLLNDNLIENFTQEQIIQAIKKAKNMTDEEKNTLINGSHSKLSQRYKLGYNK